MSFLRLGYKRTVASVSLVRCEGSHAPCWELAHGEDHRPWQGTEGGPGHLPARDETLSPTALKDPCPANKQVSRLEADSTPVSSEMIIAQVGTVITNLRIPEPEAPH